MRIGGGDVTGKILQGIPPRSGIHDATERGEDKNMIGDVTDVCASERGDVKGKFLQGISHKGGIRDAKERGEDENMIGNAMEISMPIGGGGT